MEVSTEMSKIIVKREARRHVIFKYFDESLSKDSTSSLVVSILLYDCETWTLHAET
ncbi:hypothetical protein DPMN_176958 [Dreissena polymorpha]|uniref:Uncharacterized protein n=1 Tax=Dreissena polymorpha TaxID=45954 RepID=A0A9D4E9D9_DREPO|nr:hypothetical protein DPMN_176958 [Dreissena polymorpha]